MSRRGKENRSVIRWRWLEKYFFETQVKCKDVEEGRHGSKNMGFVCSQTSLMIYDRGCWEVGVKCFHVILSEAYRASLSCNWKYMVPSSRSIKRPMGWLWIFFSWFFIFSKMFCHVFTLRYRGLICVMCNDKDFDNHDIWIQCLYSQNKWCATRLILIWKDGGVETSSIVFWSNSHIRERRKGKLIETLQISILWGGLEK